MTAPHPPCSTARLQYHAGFTLDDACEVVPYYAALGVSHLYASPVLAARTGSSHGYDVVDPTRINPELGGLDALRRLVQVLRRHDMGLILDIVPNHMAATVENPWWRDVLEWGPASPHADYFDIDWEVPDPQLRGRVLVPTLGRGIESLLAAGEVQLQFDVESAGRIEWDVAGQRFPLAAKAYAEVLGGQPELASLVELFREAAPGRTYGDALGALASHGANASGRAWIDAALRAYAAEASGGCARMGKLLERQPYLLAPWREAWHRINWRRFFDVNELVAIRPDRPNVFDATHSLVLALYAEGLIDGLRIDHIDGLVDPGGYCRKLRGRLDALDPGRPAHAPRGPAYLVVEKILALDETLREDWTADGTTGYEFMDQVSALMHDAAGEAALDRLWQTRGGPEKYETLALDARRQMTLENFAADLDRTLRALDAVAARSDAVEASTEDFRNALVELIVHFPVYRTYVGTHGNDPPDADVLEHAARGARSSGNISEPALAFLLQCLEGRGPDGAGAETARLVTLFQQLTPPVAAKAIEDTTFYRYGRLLSRNEVGAEPGELALPVDRFHAACLRRGRTMPHTLLATATHDNKRGEDARARLAVLSEMSDMWSRHVEAWTELNARHRGTSGKSEVPDPADELILYQTLVGAWPLELKADDAPALHAFTERVSQWQRKALREAKRHSSWISPDEDYEEACDRFLRACLAVGDDNAFPRELDAFVRKIAAAGAINSLSQALLRMTTPGIPDLYQGTDRWDFSMVDPDNRREVDHALRASELAAERALPTLFARWRDGALKQRLVERVLATRRRLPTLFADGTYLPLGPTGPSEEHLVAFAREHREGAAIILAPRLPWSLLDASPDVPAIPAERWAGTHLKLPAGLWENVLDDTTLEGGRPVEVAELMPRWPLALLVQASDCAPDGGPAPAS